ncbi:MAG: MFS transporter [Acidobacteria bacterium]|nr:MFS transporter [Acidobacteriota bacterium]MCI0719670.1 MFS transporter [Acidobacteriota bacterium]
MKVQPKWVICSLIFLATVISYIDRQAFGLVAPVVAKEYGFSNKDISVIAGAFLLAYAMGQMFAGKVIDLLGDRKGTFLSHTHLVFRSSCWLEELLVSLFVASFLESANQEIFLVASKF